MTSKKWLISFLLTVIGIALLIAGFNVLTDPFGVFGDPMLDWWSYNMTNNPRTAKFSYLEDHREDYDSYLIGCSSTSAFTVEPFNALYDASFYNLIVYGADMLDSEQMIAYLIEKDKPKNIVLNVYLDNAVAYDEESNAYTHSMPASADGSNPVSYYTRFLFANPEYGMAKLKNRKSDTWLSQSFDVFDPVSGEYDKRKRDIEPIGDMARYLESYPVFAEYPAGSGYTMPNKQNCLDSVGRIVRMCEEVGVNLIVVTAPVYAEYLDNFDMADVTGFYRDLAQVTDYWDFSYSSVSFEPRYFYDSTHFRNAVGDMAAARIGGEDTWIPEDFGYLVTAENADRYFANYAGKSAMTDEEFTVNLPVLMYHHLDETVTNDMTVTPETFREHMEALCDAGYTAVTLSDLLDYVNAGEDLPNKPVLITFDDGYRSVYEYAYPVLDTLGMHGTVFCVGSTFGADTYKSTGQPIIPHFGAEEAMDMAQSGVIEVQSHTWDMHQAAQYEMGTPRTCVRPLADETEQDYLAALEEDIRTSIAQLENASGETVFALAYPSGIMTDEAAAVFAENGITVTFSTEYRSNTLVRGLPQTLFGLGRYTITDSVTGDELIRLLEN
ncbi:MAG: polysaccharide deacetylase family protein [Clostridia bacterium]|nr:polysaccharide deacetylase family protein [Clostridia bacterium]